MQSLKSCRWLLWQLCCLMSLSFGGVEIAAAEPEVTQAAVDAAVQRTRDCFPSLLTTATDVAIRDMMAMIELQKKRATLFIRFHGEKKLLWHFTGKYAAGQDESVQEVVDAIAGIRTRPKQIRVVTSFSHNLWAGESLVRLRSMASDVESRLMRKVHVQAIVFQLDHSKGVSAILREVASANWKVEGIEK